jgi:hypothetical protein
MVCSALEVSQLERLDSELPYIAQLVFWKVGQRLMAVSTTIWQCRAALCAQ